MNKILALIGWRRSSDSLPLFTTWHSYAVVLIAAVVIGLWVRYVL